MESTIKCINKIHVVNKKVTDSRHVKTIVLDTDGFVRVYDKVKEKHETIKLINISLYDHNLIYEGEELVLIHMLSK